MRSGVRGERREKEGENMNEKMRIMEKSVCELMKFRVYFSFSFFFNPPLPPQESIYSFFADETSVQDFENLALTF